MTISSIDWDFWRTMPEVKVWQAIALSLGIDPDRMDQSRDYGRLAPADADVANARMRTEFAGRLQLLVAALPDPEHFTKGLVSSDTPANHRVQLKQVAAWLRLTGRLPLAESFLIATGVSQPPAAPPGAASSDDSTPDEKRPPLTELQKMQSWQEDQLRRATRSLGFDPMALPPEDRQNDFFVKAVIRTRCEKNHPVKMRTAVFNKTWDRMMNGTPPGLRYAV
jgi:hypothetical protein